MRFSNLPVPQFIYFLCASVMVVNEFVVSATSVAPDGKKTQCKLRDYDMEIFIGANANHCTPTEMKQMDQTMDKVIYQIFPTVRGLEQADMTTCSSKTQHPPDDFRRQLGGGGRRCSFCRESNDMCIAFSCLRRRLEKCRHQSWKTINRGSDNSDVMRLTTRRNTVYKTINLSSRTTYVKVDFTLFQQVNNIIQVKVNGHSPIQLEYIENETSRFRKNGILSASENYIRDNEGNLQHTKVALHIDLSQKDYDKKLLQLRFDMIPANGDEEEESEDEETVIDNLVIKGANACAVKWTKANQDEEEEESTLSETATTTAFERGMEWTLSDKLTAVLNAISDADVNHCLNGKDPIVHVNLYKISDHHEEGNLVC